MIKLFQLIFLSLLPLGLYAQTGEVIFNIYGANNYELITEETPFKSTNKTKGLFDKFLGYNHYLNSTTYFGIAGAYRERISSVKNEASITTGPRNIGFRRHSVEIYTMDIRIGKVLKYNKFKLLAELGAQAIYNSKEGSYTEMYIYDSINPIPVISTNKTSIPIAWRYNLRSTVGLYYSLVAGLSVGMDINVIASYRYSKGVSNSIVTQTLQDQTFRSFENKYYTDFKMFELYYLPSVGVRYTFGKPKN